jgi:hypothetical protein
MQGYAMQKIAMDRIIADGKDHRLFCADDRWCSYVVMRDPKNVRVFTDGREQAYPPDILADAAVMIRVKPGWREKIDAWRISDLMTTEPRLVSLLNELPNWRCSAYTGDLWVCERQR